MLTDAPVYPSLPCTDLKRTRDFYVVKLELTIVNESAGSMMLKAGDNTQIFIYKRPPSPAAHTLAAFRVKDLEATIDELSKKGVVF